MIQFLTSAIAFVVTLGILITAHEFGHFWVARKLGVKVLRFSIGFGKPLWRWQKSDDDTEFVIGALPLGGYIKMLDEREGGVPAFLRDQAFNVQSVWKRFSIVAAGPVFNFLLAILIYFLAYMIGIPGTKPVVGELEPGTYAAQAGFEYKDEILQVEGQQTESWQQVRMSVLDAALSQASIDFEVRSASGATRSLSMPIQDVELLKEQKDLLEHLGLKPWWPSVDTTIGLLDDGAAKDAGLLVGDRILYVDAQATETWIDLVKVIRAHPSVPLKVLVLREGREIEVSVIPKSRVEGDETIGYIGAGPVLDELDKLRVHVQYPFLQSVSQGFFETGKMIVLTFKMLGKLVVGEASLKNISGPLTIMDYAGRSVSIDISYYLKFLAIISISLGVLNLLPIPLLDGGHLLYYVIEIVKGSPVSEKVLMAGQQVGFVLLMCLMSIAIYNDLERIFG